MWYKKNYPLLLSSMLLFVCQFTYAAPTAQPAHNDTAIQNEVLVHINAYRQQRGLRKLKMDNHIVQVARQHSINMATHRVPFGHVGFMKRINTLRKQVKNAGAGGENVAYNYKDARTVVQNWVLSPGHKRNIVGNYDITGIGIARDKQGKIYYTQIFMRTEQQKRYARARPSFGIPFISIGG